MWRIFTELAITLGNQSSILRGSCGLIGMWYHYMIQELCIRYAMRALATGLCGDSEVSGTEGDFRR